MYTYLKIDPSKVTKFLNGLEFPTSKENLIEYAKQRGAADDSTFLLEQVSAKQFISAIDLKRTLAKVRSQVQVLGLKPII